MLTCAGVLNRSSTISESPRIHLDVDGRPAASLNTPGYVYRDHFIIGSNVNEYSVPGAVRAYNVRTGKRE